MKYLLKIADVIRCLIVLGVWQAFKVLMLAPRMRRDFPIRVRGLEKPVWIRGQTSDAWLLDQVLVRQEYSGFVSGRPQRILDGGANIGLASLYWNRLYPDAQIVAVEPDAENFKLLQKNTEHLKNLHLLQAGVWSKPVKLKVLHPSAEKYAVQVVEDESGTIEAQSIDSIMAMLGWDWIDVLKLDIEGSESQILALGSKNWVGRIGTLIIELHQDLAPDCGRALFKAFAELEFRLSWRGENLVLAFKPQQSGAK